MSAFTSLQHPTPREPYRSAGEAQIARCLDRYHIAYRYEAPLAVVDRGKVRIWYPDFQLPACGAVIEYAGVRGDPDYREALRHKQSVYRAGGLEPLVVGPEFFRGDWPERLLDRVEEIFLRRLATFRSARSEAPRRDRAPPGPPAERPADLA